MSKYSKDNPCGLKGFAFLEFSSPNIQDLHTQFKNLGFHLHATHQDAPIAWYQQGEIKILLNATPNTQAEKHAEAHGPGASAMGFRVHDAKAAHAYALAHGASDFKDEAHAHHGIPAIEAIGGSVIFFVDDVHQPFENYWNFSKKTPEQSNGLTFIDHLTHNVFRGNMDKWAQFYERIFNFQEIRYFNIVGKMTGLISRALGRPCGKIKIPLNESKDDRSQIEEFLHDYHGEGIQHVAFNTDNIYRTVGNLRTQGIRFLDVPDAYYEMVKARVPWHQEPLADLSREHILIDGEKDPEQGLLLQIFTENLFGPVFFEIIQRKGNQGFGEGNFQALFEAIERDQFNRGTLQEPNS
jgi:4-hydroxyphenylpyruvate dioxygenase